MRSSRQRLRVPHLRSVKKMDDPLFNVFGRYFLRLQQTFRVCQPFQYPLETSKDGLPIGVQFMGNLMKR